MHKTLTVRNNIVLALVWVTLLTAMLWLGWPMAMQAAGVAFAVGAFAGALQAQALDVSAEAFRTADSALQISKVMLATRAGKLSIMLLWAVGISAIIWAIAFGAGKAIPLAVSAYAAFAFARELVSPLAVSRLATKAGQGQPASQDPIPPSG